MRAPDEYAVSLIPEFVPEWWWRPFLPEKFFFFPFCTAHRELAIMSPFQNVNTHTRADRNGHEHTTTCDRQTESGDDATKKEKRKPIEHGAGGG